MPRALSARQLQNVTTAEARTFSCWASFLRKVTRSWYCCAGESPSTSGHQVVSFPHAPLGNHARLYQRTFLGMLASGLRSSMIVRSYLGLSSHRLRRSSSVRARSRSRRLTGSRTFGATMQTLLLRIWRNPASTMSHSPSCSVTRTPISTRISSGPW